MIFHPSVLALLLASTLVCVMVFIAARFGSQILTHWNLESGSEIQLTLERRTYLVSALLSNAMVFQVASLFLYIYASDTLAPYLLGAMCATGTLAATPWGYPTLIIKVVNATLGGFWLVINHCDSRGEDYPLIRFKYRMLIVMAPLFLLEAVFQAAHFTGIDTDVITSCCGSLFGPDSGTVASSLTGLPVVPAMVLFYGTLAITLVSGFRYYRLARGEYLFSGFAAGATFVSLAALLSFLCLYHYESPIHYCPFCILRADYSHMGYLYYVLIFLAGFSGMGVGVLKPFSSTRSIAETLRTMQRRLTIISMTGFGALGILSLYGILGSNLVLVR